MKKVPAITVKQMRKVDDLMMNHYGVSAAQMMEHDGVALTLVAKKILRNVAKKKIVVAFGPGGNGGGALVGARMLHNAGAKVYLVTAAASTKLSKDTKYQLQINKKIGLKLFRPTVQLFKKADLIIDGLLGYSVRGAPKGKIALIIEIIKASRKRVLANDIPTGVDPDTGQVYKPAIRAHTTLTIALPKTGLYNKNAEKNIGRLYLADITVPDELYKKLKIRARDVFKGEPIIPLI